MTNLTPVNLPNRVFIDGSNVYLKQRPKRSKSYSKNKNIVKNGNNLFVDLVPGYDYNKFKKKEVSSLENTENLLLRNNSYRIISDGEFSHINTSGQKNVFPYYDYDDVENIKRKNRVTKVNFEKTIGLNNNLDYIDNKNSKFIDIDDKTKYLINSNDEDDVFIYPWLLNDFDIDSRGANIDILGNISEIKRDSIFITSIVGFKTSFNLVDMRNRNITIRDNVDKYNYFEIENFLEHKEDTILYSRNQVTKKGKFEKTLVNKVVAYKFNTSSSRIIESVNHELSYISEEASTYKPFNEKEEKYAIFQELVDSNNSPRNTISGPIKDHFTNSVWNQNTNNIAYPSENFIDGVVYSSRGRDFDYSVNNGIESIAFVGGLD